jgi:hypothetical protein
VVADDPRSLYKSGMYPSGGSSQGVRIDLGAGGKALSIIGMGNIGDTVPAEPVMLSNPNCATIRRLWLVEPDKSITWIMEN